MKEPTRRRSLFFARDRSDRTRRLGALVLTLTFALAACGGDEPEAEPEPPEEEVTETPDAGSEEPEEPAADDGEAEQAGADACDPDTPRTLRMSAPSTGFIYLAAHIAEAEGYFAEEGLEIERFEAAGGNVPALVSGDVDLADSAFTNVLNLRNEGRDVVAIGVYVNANTSNVVMSGEMADEIGFTEDWSFEERVAALEGRRFGVTSPGSGTDTLARALLEEAGLDPESGAEVIYLDSGSNVLAAFDQGQIDVLAFSPPTSTQAELTMGGVRLLDIIDGDYPAQADGFMYTSIIATESWLEDEENRAAAGCYLRAIERAFELIQDDADLALELGTDSLGIDDPELAQAAFETIYPAYPTTVRPDVEAAQRAYDFDSQLREVEQPLEAHLDLTVADDYLE